MSFSDYFEPFDASVFPNFQPLQHTIGDSIHFVSSIEEIKEKKIKLVLLGVQEGRNAIDNEDCANAPDYIRKHLFGLYPDECSPKIGDLGNLPASFTPEDTYFKLLETLELLLKNDIVPVILGGGNELGYFQYNAYKQLEQMVTLVAVDSGFDFGHLGSPFSSQTFTERIITDEPTHLYSYGNIGYQAYFTDPAIIQMMEKLNFDLHRLGKARGNIDHLEPVIRNADLLLFDIGAIKQSDAPGNSNASPNGFYAEEACKVMKYAGMSDKVSSVGIYELNPRLDKNQTTAKLAAQMIWCFIEGFYNRKGDYPVGDVKSYQRFTVEMNGMEEPMVFYKSDRSGRWWIEAPKMGKYANKSYRQRLVPCNYDDYLAASKNQIPDTWWAHLLKD